MEILLARVFPGTMRSGARNSSYDLMSQKPAGKVFDAVIYVSQGTKKPRLAADL